MPQLPLTAIDDSALPRDRTTLDPAALNALTASIAAEGLRQPIEVFELAHPQGPHLYGLFTTPHRLSAARIDALAAALRLGFEDALTEALLPLRGQALDTQWQAIAPLLAESRSPRGAPGLTPGRPRRTLTLRQGLTIRREMTRTGWLLRFSGPEARSGGLIDDVLDEVERLFQVR